jgi:GT2 family glycosyltransferase
MEPLVYVLVLNWNNWKDTNKCLASLQGLAYTAWKVIVVDNGSTDGSVHHIRDEHPAVEVLELEKNGGFAKGNNAGIRRALERKADYVWLLNNDTTVSPDALRALVTKAESHPRLGALGSAIYSMAEPDRLQVWGGGRVNFWLGRSRHFVEPLPDQKIEFLTGASLFLRRSALEAVGLLDEGFFMYWEDADYCFRLRRAGWGAAVAGDSRVWHKEQGSVGKKSVLLDAYFNKSAKRFFARHAPLPLIPIWTGITLRVAKRLILGDWERARAVWAASREEAV